MNELSSYLRRTLCEAWRNGYGEEARRAAIVAPLLTLVRRVVLSTADRPRHGRP